MARRAALPVTGPSGDATSRQRTAQAQLDERNAMKRAAALRDFGADTSAENARRAKRGGAWVQGTRDELSGTT